MLKFLRHPLSVVSNRFTTSGSATQFIHSDRSLLVGIATSLLTFVYLGNLVNYTSDILSGVSPATVIFPLFLAIASVLVFSFLFLRSLVFSKRLGIENSRVVVCDFWPLSFLESKVDLADIDRITVTTVFTHLSKRATLFLTIRTRSTRRLKKVYTCHREELNSLVDQLSDLLRAAGIEVRVDNENVL